MLWKTYELNSSGIEWWNKYLSKNFGELSDFHRIYAAKLNDFRDCFITIPITDCTGKLAEEYPVEIQTKEFVPIPGDYTLYIERYFTVDSSDDISEKNISSCAFSLTKEDFEKNFVLAPESEQKYDGSDDLKIRQALIR